MMGVLRQTAEGLLDLIYPPVCLACRMQGASYVCESCLAKIEPVAPPYCEVCGRTIVGAGCRNCLARSRSFAKARAAADYSGVMKDLVHEFKYHGARCLADPLSRFMYDFAERTSAVDLQKADCLIPVPIHAIRKRIRGYNQSELLADGMSRLSGIPALRNVLTRRIYTRPQVELSREQRMTNMQAAFHAETPHAVVGKTVLLIDDVSTTSSTIHECSKILLDSGALEVNVLCLAFDT